MRRINLFHYLFVLLSFSNTGVVAWVRQYPTSLCTFDPKILIVENTRTVLLSLPTHGRQPTTTTTTTTHLRVVADGGGGDFDAAGEMDGFENDWESQADDPSNPCWQDLYDDDCSMSNMYAANFVASKWIQSMPCAEGMEDCDMQTLAKPGMGAQEGAVDQVDVKDLLGLKVAKPVTTTTTDDETDMVTDVKP